MPSRCLLLLICVALCLRLAPSFRCSSSWVSRGCISDARSMKFSSSMLMAPESGASVLEPKPGSPVVKKLDKETAVAVLSVALTAAQTQKSFAQACEMLNEEVKSREYKVPGFRPGSKLPPNYLYQIFGEDRVKLLCGNLMSEEIQDECDKSGLMFVGRGRITNFNQDQFVGGKPHVLEIECDLWPEIKYAGEKGYKGLKCSAVVQKEDNSKYEAVKKNIMERYKVLTPSTGGAAAMGDVLTASMNGFERNPDGSKGPPLPAIAVGDKVEIIMEKGKFMEGMVEGLVGVKAGETRPVNIKFPVRPSGPGAALSGKEAIFDVTVSAVSVKTLPTWDATLANRIREGMTLSELEDEVRKAIVGEAESSSEVARNDALATALLAITTMSKVPESLVEENTQTKFQQMLMDFKEQGSTDEQLQEMASEENYNKYKSISRPGAEKVVTLGMVFRDIAEKEKVSVTREEISQQLDAINAQAKQKGEGMPDQRRAADEIENVMLRRKIFDLLASSAEISWVKPPDSA